MAPIHNARAIDTGHPSGASGMISIRPMEDRDIKAARDLVAQLGYPMEEADFRRRYAAVAGADSHALMIAEDQGRVAALCHVFLRAALDKPPEAVVQALVVDEARRGRSIGAAMMARAEEWAARKGLR